MTMPTQEELLQAQIDALEAQRMSGTRSVRDQNGEQVDHMSGSEMAAALATAKRQLLALTKQPVTTILFRTCKGVW
jgi:hypothetical protein